jgi:hypothetical protein
MRFIVLILFIPSVAFSQVLDEINTIEESELFIKKNFRYYDRKYDDFTIDRTNNINYDSYKFGDFNHDEIKDLLVFGEVEVSKGKETYLEDEILIIIGEKRTAKKVKFPYNFFRDILTYTVPRAKIIDLNGKDHIQINHTFYNRSSNEIETFTDTVFVNNEHLIPYSTTLSEKTISRIEFKTDYCYGTCPVFELNINQNGEVYYNGIDHVVKKGNLKLRIDKEDWNYLESLFKHIKVEDLNSNYNVNWTDDQTGFLTVFFEDGDKIQIEDYGMSGTFGLAILFDYLFELIKF